MHLFVSKQLNLFIFISFLVTFLRVLQSRLFASILLLWYDHHWNATVLSQFSLVFVCVCQNRAIQIKRLFMSNALFLTPQDFDCLFLFRSSFIFLVIFFYFVMPILHTRQIDHNDRSDPCFYLYDDFNFGWHFFPLVKISFSVLFISFEISSPSLWMRCQQWTIFQTTSTNTCVWQQCLLARQCHPLRIPHAYHKKPIILISIFVLRFLFTRISRYNNAT